MNNRKAFTIVELITTVSIIALLLGLLLPSIAMVRAKAKETAQKAQFNTIEMGLEAFKQDYGDYPPSKWSWVPALMPNAPDSYCGAQKLAEALLGWDLMGFHSKTGWQANGFADAFGSTASYDPGFTRRVPPITGQPVTLNERKGHYIELATANAFRLGELYNLNNDTNVICDVYRVRKLTDKTGKTVFAGSPILYYKANTANKTIDAPPPAPPQTFTNRIYDYYDNVPITANRKLTANGPAANPWHPLGYLGGAVFYSDKYIGPPLIPNTHGGSGTGYGIRDPKISSPLRPYNPDTYILISAGPDGYYGTADDIHNF